MNEHDFGEANHGKVHCSFCNLTWPANLVGDAPDCCGADDGQAQPTTVEPMRWVHVSLVKRAIEALASHSGEHDDVIDDLNDAISSGPK